MATAHESYAQIVDGNIVNIISWGINNGGYPEVNHLTHMVYGDDAIAISCQQYIVGIGDKYHDGVFWGTDPETEEEVPAEYLPTQNEKLAQLKAENEELTLALAEMIGGAL